jgi:tRNA 5-methylaminomethyl-2-thiouridine biosynthesis bifunctional protein
MLHESLLFMPRSRALSLSSALPFMQVKARVASLGRDADDGGWQAFDEQGRLIGSAGALVLTSPQALVRLGFDHAMALQTQPGVSLIIDLSDIPSAHKIWQIGAIHAGQQQVVRLSNPDQLLVGALYGEPTDQEARASLFAAIQPLLSLNGQELARLARAPSRLWRGVRYSAPDHLPMIGAIADGDRMSQQWDRLKTNARLPIPRLQGAYALTALGARGALWAPFGAEILLDMMQSIPCPLESDLLVAIDPARAMIRALRRGIIPQAQSRPSSN